MNKIKNLKNDIDQELVEDPLTKLKAKLESKNISFSIKEISKKNLKLTLKKLKKKKSTGCDRLSQEQLIWGKFTD